MGFIKNIALVAHDGCKRDMVEWVSFNYKRLAEHRLICTGTTGRLVEEEINRRGDMHILVTRLRSGPLGGDQQLGALIAEGKIDMMVFLWDPMQQQPHDVDVKALLRITALYNVPTACNRSTADFLISSPLFESDYAPIVKNYNNYVNRKV